MKTTQAFGQGTLNIAPIRSSSLHSDLNGVSTPNSESLAALLRLVLRPAKGKPTLSIKEAYRLCGLSDERQVYKWIKEEANPTALQFMLIANECAKRGDVRLIELVLPSGWHIAPGSGCEPDGCIEDNMTRFAKNAGLLVDRWEHCDMPGVDASLTELESDLVGLKEERKLRA